MQGPLIVASLIALGFGFVVMVILLIRRAEKARQEQLQSVAGELGLEFHPAADSQVMSAIGHFRLFNQGHGRKSINMISGQTEEIDLAVFGYRYTTGGGQQQQVHTQTVISFQSPNLALPEFELRPETMFHKIGQAFGYKDINFDSHPTFSKKYVLRGPDEAAVREFFTPQILEDFESQDGVSVEAAGHGMIYYRGGKRIKPEQIRSFMEEGFHVYGLLNRDS